jgi:hypothetical protein
MQNKLGNTPLRGKQADLKLLPLVELLARIEAERYINKQQGKNNDISNIRKV